MDRRVVLLISAVSLLPALAEASSRGLSLRIDNGVSPTVEVINGDKRFFDELDIVSAIPTATDEGIDPVVESGDLSHLDWDGVEMTDEEWRPDGFGAFTRQRFFRNAAWMEAPSIFLVFQIDDKGKYLPELPYLMLAGSDDLWSAFDSYFIRRFSARQITTGCASVGDCSAATGHVAQGLVQLRQAQYPSIGDQKINKKARKLRIFWTADPLRVRDVPVQPVQPAQADYAYGFDVDFAITNPPANGDYYVPGEALNFELQFTDGEGNPLDDDGSLPTYADFLDNGTASGLRYFDVGLNPTLYYALKHREGNLLLAMGGPSDLIRVTDYSVPVADFFLPEVPVAFADEHGFSAVISSIPPLYIILGGLFDPTVWNAPVSNEVVMHVPADALPGTYVIALKARRLYDGEAINSGEVQRIQVGTDEVTEWEPTTVGCNDCHSGQSALGNVLHGISDRESCLASCHAASLENEPDGVLDYRIHFVHSRSDRYPADINNCLVCHVEQPDDVPRGYPGFTYPFD